MALLGTGFACLAAQGQHPQNQIPPTRRDFVFHVYVDPLFGDDIEAAARNPVAMPTPNRLRPLDIHQDPGDAADPHPIAGVLQHAPFSFQTLGAAVTYARQFLPGAQIPRAFWTNTIQFDTELAIFTVSRIVVHCLPGLYGPRLGTPIDPDSGIPFNGEQWPVQLPSFLSIQGTSALDTIFDAREQSTYVIGVPAGAGDLPEGEIDAHRDSFIDSVTIRNAAEGSEGQPGAGAGIRVFHAAPLAALVPSSFLSITNCFLVNNAVGIGVDSFVPGRPDHAHHVRIVNNTVAFNRIGLWSGNSQATEPRPAENVLLVLNTIFDSGAVGALSGFEGISTDERELNYRGSGGLPFQYFFGGLDTNAWEPNRVNLQVGLVNWPVTQARIPGGMPVVDITLYTQLSPSRVGCLYVADIFDAAWTPGYSPHDLRLAPVVTTNRNVPPSVLNPLVNRGIGPVPGGSPQLLAFPIVMMSGQRLEWSPGLPPDAEGRAGPAQIPTPVHGWDYDGEGFGNLRDQPRVGFPVNPVPELGEMDIGADEMGRYIIAGFFNGTRILSPDPVPNAPLAAPHGRIFFFDLPGPPSPRPVCNIYPGGYAYWFDHVQGTIDAEVNNYTVGATIGSTTPLQFATRTMLNSFGWNPFMRGLWCDFTPHLVPDLHPFWGGWMADPAATPPMANDIYAANPWYDDPARASVLIFPSRGRFDNPALFHNFHVPGYTASTSWPQFGAPMYVRDATLNPPGTYPLGTPWATGTNGPWTLFPNQILGPYAPCGGTSLTTYSVGVWGFGDTPAGCPDIVPGTAGGTLLLAALRFNCEWFDTNLQTFLGIRTPPPVGGRSSQQASATRVSPTPAPTKEEMREVVRRVMERN